MNIVLHNAVCQGAWMNACTMFASAVWVFVRLFCANIFFSSLTWPFHAFPTMMSPPWQLDSCTYCMLPMLPTIVWWQVLMLTTFASESEGTGVYGVYNLMYIIQLFAPIRFTFSWCFSSAGETSNDADCTSCAEAISVLSLERSQGRSQPWHWWCDFTVILQVSKNPLMDTERYG